MAAWLGERGAGLGASQPWPGKATPTASEQTLAFPAENAATPLIAALARQLLDLDR